MQQHCKTRQNSTKLNKILKQKLYTTFTKQTVQLYTTIHNYTQPYNTLQHSTQFYRTIHNS